MKNQKILLSNIYEKLNDSCADFSALIRTTFFIFPNGVIFMLDNDIYCTIVSRIYVLVLCLSMHNGFSQLCISALPLCPSRLAYLCITSLVSMHNSLVSMSASTQPLYICALSLNLSNYVLLGLPIYVHFCLGHLCQFQTALSIHFMAGLSINTWAPASLLLELTYLVHTSLVYLLTLGLVYLYTIECSPSALPT